MFTSLTKEALPVIRYRTRDLTRLLPPTARSMRRMAKITGRSDDMMIVRGVNVFPTQIEELILRCEGLAAHYQLELTRDGQLDVLTVHVESMPDALPERRGRGAGAHTAHQEPRWRVRRRLRQGPGAIERSLGKAKRVVDRDRRSEGDARPEG